MELKCQPREQGSKAMVASNLKMSNDSEESGVPPQVTEVDIVIENKSSKTYDIKNAESCKEQKLDKASEDLKKMRTDKEKAYSGSWVLTKIEGYEEYTKALGYGWMIRKLGSMGQNFPHTLSVNISGNRIKLSTSWPAMLGKVLHKPSDIDVEFGKLTRGTGIRGPKDILERVYTWNEQGNIEVDCVVVNDPKTSTVKEFLLPKSNTLVIHAVNKLHKCEYDIIYTRG